MSDPDKRSTADGAERGSTPNAADDLDRILNLAVETVSRESMQTGEKTRALFESKVDVLDDVGAAHRLSVRHNSQRITDELVSHVLAYMDTHDPAAFTAIDETLRDRAKKHGFFLEHYPVDKMQHRLRDRYANGGRKFIIAEASAKSRVGNGEFVPCADAQFRIPDTGRRSHVTELPQDGDDVVNKDLVEQLRSMPYAFASLDDIVSEPAYERLGFASSVLKRGLHEIITVENPERGVQKIRHVTACIASIQGVELSNGIVWRFHEDAGITPIFNDRSGEVFEHLRSEMCSRFRTAYVLRERRVPVRKHPRVQSIIVDWHTKIADLKTLTQ